MFLNELLNQPLSIISVFFFLNYFKIIILLKLKHTLITVWGIVFDALSSFILRQVNHQIDLSFFNRTRDELFKEIQDFKPEGENVKAAKILMLGHVGSGKSSFVNSINSVFAGRLCQTAIAGNAGTSFTLQFRFWNIKPVQGKSIPVQLCDTMGLEDTDNGISEEDLISTIMGHVQKNYTYNQTCPIQKKDPSYRKYPLLGDQVHCVVYVINCRQLSLLEEHLLMKYRNVRRDNRRGFSIPQVAILTHCDEACEEVEKDLKNVFRSKYINKMVIETINSEIYIFLKEICHNMIVAYSGLLHRSPYYHILSKSMCESLWMYVDK
uniref:G domain-containing protein n=1 Tax=Eptatretus burgeri TaxID=7764 RepID=A0A8C4Q9S9_EPTBU